MPQLSQQWTGSRCYRVSCSLLHNKFTKRSCLIWYDGSNSLLFLKQVLQLCQQLGPQDRFIAQDACGTRCQPLGVPLLPGGGTGTELPFPQPNDLIPRTGVPVPSATPVPAPGDGGAALLPVPKLAVPVKGSK